MDGEIGTSGRSTAAETIRQLIYTSSTRRDHSSTEMDELLALCRRDNKICGITGMLLYKDGHFMQVLEGAPDVVGLIYDKIRKDKRHHGVILVLDRIARARDFSNWSMGYRRLNRGDVPGEGFSDVLLRIEEPDEGAPLTIRLLQHFSEGIRE